MRRYYQIDIARYLGTPSLTYRRLFALLGALPRESAYMQVRLGDAGVWSHTDHLIASVIDAIGGMNRNLVQSRSKKKIPDYKPIKRPGVEESKDAPKTLGAGGGVSPAELSEWLRRPRVDVEEVVCR